jgi:hypothetical protein
VTARKLPHGLCSKTLAEADTREPVAIWSHALSPGLGEQNALERGMSKLI